MDIRIDIKRAAVGEENGREYSHKSIWREKTRPAVPTNLMELKVRGNFEGAPIIPLLALESDYISNTGPYVKTKFAETLWLENKQLADDRFDKIQSDEEEPSGILIGQDQADFIMENKAAI